MRIAASAVSAAALILTACSQGAEAPSEAAPAADKASGSAPISLTDIPKPRPGVWKTTTRANGGEAEVTTQCIGADETFDLGQKQEGCEPILTRRANGFNMTAQCTTGGMTGGSSVTMTGDFQKRVNVDMRISVRTPDGQTHESNMTGESVWQGPCEPGQEPGLMDDGE